MDTPRFLSGKLLPDAARTRWGELLGSIAHPLAVLIATITRRKLEAELSIAIHLAAIVGTFALAGACLGWLLSRR